MNTEKQDESTNKKEDKTTSIDINKKNENNDKDKVKNHSKWEKIRNRIFRRPIVEISHSWYIINEFADRTDKYKELSPCQEYTLKKVKNYLKLAKKEKNFARAWSYTNMADALLPLIVENNDFPACLLRFQVADEYLPDNLKKIVQNIDPTHTDDKLLSSGDKKISKKKVNKKQRRHLAHQAQLIRGMLWNNANCNISLRISLWHSFTIGLLLIMALAISISEFAYNASNLEKTIVPFPFAFISILGFFGGGLSSIIIARKSVINITL